jgi:3-oxoacyl-(acyl-carrier-protein) synthase
MDSADGDAFDAGSRGVRLAEARGSLAFVSAHTRQERTPIVMTGMGAVSALGDGVAAIVRAMMEGRDGLSELTRFDMTALHPIRFAGWLREPWQRSEPASLDRWVRAAVREAWNDAGLSTESIDPERIAVVSGTTLGEEGALSRSADAAADEVGARGPRWGVVRKRVQRWHMLNG